MLRLVLVHVPSDIFFYFRIRVNLTSRISFHVCISTKGRPNKMVDKKVSIKNFKSLVDLHFNVLVVGIFFYDFFFRLIMQFCFVILAE